MRRSTGVAWSCLATVALALGTTTPRAQDTQDLEVLLDRLATYLVAYEAQLTTVVAEERYEQFEYRRLSRTAWHVQRQRRLQSDIAFLRLPDNSAWFGVRDVRLVDGKAVPSDNLELQKILKSFGERSFEEAARIVARSAAHNLGGARTINMPTVPLEVLQPNHHVRFVFKVGGRSRISRMQTRRIDFEEFDDPTIIHSTDGGPVFINGSAWIEPDTGALWRVTLSMSPEKDADRRRLATNHLRVDFVFEPDLKMMVPKEMVEVFLIEGGRGEGKATYSNFRQFTTSGRIVPQR